MSKLELALIEYANNVTDWKDGKNDKTIGEVIDPAKYNIKQLLLELLGEQEDRNLPVNRNWKLEIDARNMFRDELKKLIEEL